MLMPHLKSYLAPGTLEEALRALKEGDGSTVAIAGATSSFWQRSHSFSEVVDITCLPLSYIREEGECILVGATTDIAALEGWKGAGEFCGGVLARACESLASSPLRNMITAGGNCMGLFPWSDLPPLLLCLDAGFRMNSARDEIPAEAFFSKHPLNRFDRADLLLEIGIPRARGDLKGIFRKVTRTKFDRAILNVAVTAGITKGVLTDVRLAVGGIEPLPRRLHEVERLLEGRPAGGSLFREAGEKGAGVVSLTKSAYSSVDWRRNLVKVTIEQILEELFAPEQN